MNELPNNPEKPNMGGPVVPPETYVTPAPAGPGEPRVPETSGLGALLQKPQNVAILALAVLLAMQTWSTHTRFNRLREDVARTLQKDNASNAETAQRTAHITFATLHGTNAKGV